MQNSGGNNYITIVVLLRQMRDQRQPATVTDLTDSTWCYQVYQATTKYKQTPSQWKWLTHKWYYHFAKFWRNYSTAR